MSDTVTVTSKGQLTLPIAVREKLGIRKGSRLRVEVGEGEILLKPLRPLSEARGLLKGAFVKGEALGELTKRRGQVEAQFESCLLAIQNLRFDLLRLRSAGLAAALGDVTTATQQVKALSLDIDAAISAAGEIRDALGQPR